MIPHGGRIYRYPPGRNMPDVPMPGVAGGMLSVPYDMGGLPLRNAGMSQPIPIGALASALANATPEQQRAVCFSRRFPCKVGFRCVGSLSQLELGLGTPFFNSCWAMFGP